MPVFNNALAGAAGQAGGAGAGYTIDRSLRFNDDDSSYLNKTFVSGNVNTYTVSFWVKRGNLGSFQTILSSATGSTSQPRASWDFTTDDRLYLGFNPSGSSWLAVEPDRRFRDTTAWYHIVVSVDTTQSTNTDKVKVYVNGVREETFNTYSTLPANLNINNAVGHAIGRYQAGTSNYFDGYLAEFHFIDGQALDETDFGEFDVDGVWQPKQFTGNYNVTVTPTYPAVYIGSPGAYGSVADVNSGSGVFSSAGSSGAGYIKVEFASPINNVTHVKFRGGAYSAGSTFDIKINGATEASGLTVQSGWTEDTRTLSATANISSIEFSSSDGWALGNLKFSTDGTNYSNPSGTPAVAAAPGANGFYLDFSDNSSDAALGNDAAGSNNWSGNSLTGPAGSSPDVPPSGSSGYSNAWIGFYMNNNSSSGQPLLLLRDPSDTDRSTAGYQHGGTTGQIWSLDDVLQWAIDWDNQKVWIGRNNTWIPGDVAGTTTNPNPSTGTDPAVANFDTSYTYFLGNGYDSANFQLQVPSTATYTPPTGFSYWGGASLSSWKVSGTNQGGVGDVYQTGIPKTGKTYIEAIVKGGFALHSTLGLMNFGETASDSDSFLDSPTNYDDETNIGGNYATLNALHKGSTSTLSNGNLKVTGTGWATTVSTIGMSSGKWYAEVKLDGAATNFGVGVSALDTAYTTSYFGQTADSYCWFVPSGGLYTAGSYINSNAPWSGSLADGDVIGLALDMDNGTLKYYKNGNLQGGGNAFTGITGTQFFATCSYNNAEIWNFGAKSFAHTPPTGYKALCTQNFDAPEISKGSDYFDIARWNGDNTSPRDITGFSFKPDLVWTKTVNQNYFNNLYDSIRGARKPLHSNNASDVDTTNDALYGGVSDFNSDGFELTAGNDPNYPHLWTNSTGDSFIAWAWDGGNLATNSAYNQDTVWSGTAGANFSNADKSFDGSLSTGGAISSSGTDVTITTASFTGRILRFYKNGSNDASLTKIIVNGTEYTLPQQSFTDGWNQLDLGSATTITSLATNWSAGSYTLYAVEVDGKMLVNTGVIPVGSLNSSVYDQSQTWSTLDTWPSASYSTASSNVFNGVYGTQNTPDFWYSSGASTVDLSNVATALGTGVTNIKIWIFDRQGDVTVTVNSATATESQNNAYQEISIDHDGSAITTFTIQGTDSNYWGIGGIKVNGKMLTDSNVTLPVNFPSIAPTVAANPTAGFSIITLDFPSYSGTSSVAHGLNAAPHFWMMKDLDSSDSWYTGHISLGGGNYFKLDTADPQVSSTALWDNKLPDSLVIYNNGTSMSGAGKYVMYAWAPVEGYSAFGSYTGNGDTSGEGPFVFTNFRPALVMIKTVTTGESGWTFVQDSAREPNNVSDSRLFWGDGNQEVTATGLGGATSYELDILSNGFKIRNAHNESNVNGKKYVYACWAENPFRTARAR